MSGEEYPVQSTSWMRRVVHRLIYLDRRIILAVAALLTFTGVASVPGTVVSEWTKQRMLGASQAVSGVRIIFPGTGPTSTSTTTSTAAASTTTSSWGAVPGVNSESQPGRAATAAPPLGRPGAAPQVAPPSVSPQVTPPPGTPQATPSVNFENPKPPPMMTLRTASPTPQGFRVIEAMLRADPFNYTGTCPTRITFSGRISVAGGGGTVSFKFLRSDGASAPVQTLHFDGPGSQDVTTTWDIGGPGFSYKGWEAIQIYDPNNMQSTHANFEIQCK
jgi:hypothetical protein